MVHGDYTLNVCTGSKHMDPRMVRIMILHLVHMMQGFLFNAKQNLSNIKNPKFYIQILPLITSLLSINCTWLFEPITPFVHVRRPVGVAKLVVAYHQVVCLGYLQTLNLRNLANGCGQAFYDY